MANNSSMLVPGDFAVDQAAIDRKRAIIDAIAKNSKMGEGQMVSGHYVAPSWAEGLAQLYGAYQSKKGNEDLDKEATDLNQRYQTGLGDAVNAYVNKRNGTPGTEAQGPMPDGSAMTGMVGAQTADPRGAIIDAMTSQYKPLQTLGQAELGSLGKSTMTAKDILALPGYSPNSKVAAAQAGDVSLLKREAKFHPINGQLIQEGDDEAPAKSRGDFRDKFGTVGSIGKTPQGEDILGQLDSSTGEAKFAPKGIQVNVNSGQKGADAFATKSGEAAVKQIEDSYAAAKKAQIGYDTFTNAKQLLGQVKGGTGADLILGAKKLVEQLGGQFDPSITSTEQVGAALGQAVLDNAKALGSGSGFSNTDREFLQNIVLGKINLDQKSLERAVNIGLTHNINTLREHEKLLDQAGKIPGADPNVLQQFQVQYPEIHLNAEHFDYDPRTRRFSVKSSLPDGSATPQTPAKPAAPPVLSSAEQAELDALRAKHKR